MKKTNIFMEAAVDIRKDTLKNGLYTVVAQLITVPLQFIFRYAMLRYIGVELLGVNTTVASVVGFLALAEGGIGSAIIYSLYKPLAENDITTINKLMNIYRSIYNALGIGIMAFGILCLPFIHLFLKGIVMTPTVYLLFLLNCVNSSASYFFGYKRNLFYADVKDYLAKRVDIICNVIFSILNVSLIFMTKNIIVYCIVLIIKTITSNGIIFYQCNKRYPYLKKDNIDRLLLKEVLNNAKSLFAGSIAGYVYKSTDNVVISAFSNAANVGYLSNYTLISTNIKNVTIQFLNSFTPMIGRKLNEYETCEGKRELFYKYDQICYVFAVAVCVPCYVLIESFISNCWGAEFLMDPSIRILLVIEMYIYLASSGNGVFIVTSGKFKLLKNVETVGAVLNLIISLVLVNFIDVDGVLLGTIISAFVQWVVRSYGVCTDILKYNKKNYIIWMLRELYKIILMVFSIGMCLFLNHVFAFKLYLTEFFVMGVVSFVVSAVIYQLFYYGKGKISFRNIRELLKMVYDK